MTQETFAFQGLENRRVEANFDGGYLSSNGDLIPEAGQIKMIVLLSGLD